MEVFSEVRASLSPKLVERSTSFHKVLEEVEARTKVDIRFTNRNYVFCGSWKQIEKVREILEQVYEVSPSQASAEESERSSTSSSPLHAPSRARQPSETTRQAPVTARSRTKPKATVSSTLQATKNSTSVSVPVSDQPAPVVHKARSTTSKAPVRPSEVSRSPVGSPSTPTDVTRADEAVKKPEPVSREETTTTELNSPELMMDTDMWEYMARMHGYELRQLYQQFHVELKPSSTEELTQVKIIPGKGKAVSADMMEAACLQLGNLYQSLFTNVVVETCKVPRDLDDQAICQGAKEEVSSMFPNVLTKQNDYDPRVFTFIGSEQKAKEARYSFMDLIGMHPISTRPRGHGRRVMHPDSHEYNVPSPGYPTPGYSIDADVLSSGMSSTSVTQPPKSKSPTRKLANEESAPARYPVSESPAFQQTQAMSSDSDEDHIKNLTSSSDSFTPAQQSVLNTGELDDKLALEGQARIGQTQRALSLENEERPDYATQDVLMSLPVRPDQYQSKNKDLLDFTVWSSDWKKELALATEPSGTASGVPSCGGFQSASLSGTGAFQTAAQAKEPDVQQTTDSFGALNLGGASSGASCSSPVSQVRYNRGSAVDFDVVDAAATKAAENVTSQSLRMSSKDLDLSFLDDGSADDGRRETKKDTSETYSSSSRYGKAGKAMPQENPFDSARSRTTDAKQQYTRDPARKATSPTSGTTHGAASGFSFMSSNNRPSGETNLKSGARMLTSSTDLCEGCVQIMKNPREMPCSHVFCQECCDIALGNDHTCSRCGVDWWKVTGDQPEGTLNIVIDKKASLPGYSKVGTICVSFTFPSGRQGDSGKPHEAYQGNTYLPNNADGRMLLKQLKKTFDRKLLFTTKPSASGVSDKVSIVGVTLKPEPNGVYGYPDPEYLEQLKADLKYRGATFDV